MTYFIEVTIKIPENIKTFQKNIQIELLKYGQPLRWAITKVDIHKKTAQLEAVVIKSYL